MAISLTGTGITTPAGTFQHASPTIVGWNYAEYSARSGAIQSMNTFGTALWTAHVNYNRKSSTSGFRLIGQIPGHNRYSYPYWGMALHITPPGASTISIPARGTFYQACPENESVEVIWWTDTYIPASTLGSSTGNFTVQYAQMTQSGSGSNGFAETWNPNSNDDGRGAQTGSTSLLLEEEIN